MMPTRPL